MVTRRALLKALGAGALLSAGGIALIEAEPIVRTYFLPPRAGWPLSPYAWEIEIANEALRILNRKLGLMAESRVPHVEGAWTQDGFGGEFRSGTAYACEQVIWVPQRGVANAVGPMLERRARLIDRLDKLARGWKPARTVTELMRPDGVRQQVIIHGGMHTLTRRRA